MKQINILMGSLAVLIFVNAFGFSSPNGTPVWYVVAQTENNTETINSTLDVVEDVDYTILSKVDLLESINTELAAIGSAIEMLEESAEAINFESCCELLNSQIDTIESTIDSVTECAPNMITSAPITINSAGNYCLANNVTGTISINTSNVSLDLNGKVVIGSVVISSSVANQLSKISVKHGSITGSSSDCLRVNSYTTDVVLKDLVITNATDNGIFVNAGGITNSVRRVVIDSVMIQGCGLSGCRIITSVNISVINSKFFDNTSFGLSFSIGGDALKVDGCWAESNGNGFSANAVERLTISNCISKNHLATNASGFSTTGTNVTIFNCYADANYFNFALGGNGIRTVYNCYSSNATFLGFQSGSGARLNLDRCYASYSSNSNFRFLDSEPGLVKNCVAFNGDSYGFQISFPDDQITWAGNYATQNAAGNYNPAAGAPFFVATNNSGTYFQNTSF